MSRLRHHPTEVVLAGYASGALADGPSLTVSAHLDLCPACRSRVALFEQVGGALLADVEQVDMADDALARALAGIERPQPARRASTPVSKSIGGLALPSAVARREIGARRWVGPGIWVAPIKSNAADGWRTYLMRVPQGVAMPHHGHHGPEFTTVLQGAFVDDNSVFAAGDFGESGEGLEHAPSVHGDSACICLISGQGGIKTSGLMSLVKSFLRV